MVGDRKLTGRVITGASDGTLFLAVNTRRIPLQECRRALNLASIAGAFGTRWEVRFTGDYATTTMSPRVRGSQTVDPLGLLDGSGGRPEASKADDRTDEGLSTTVTVAFPDFRATFVVPSPPWSIHIGRLEFRSNCTLSILTGTAIW